METTTRRPMTPGQAADLAEHLRSVHGQVRMSAAEATDPAFLLALHRVACDQNPEECGSACAPFAHAEPVRTDPTRLSRNHSHRGQHVILTLRSGETLTGTLLAWGPMVIRIRTADGWTEKANCAVRKVNLAPTEGERIIRDAALRVLARSEAGEISGDEADRALMGLAVAALEAGI